MVLGELARGGKDGDVPAGALRDAPVVRAQRGLTTRGGARWRPCAGPLPPAHWRSPASVRRLRHDSCSADTGGATRPGQVEERIALPRFNCMNDKYLQD